MFICFEIKIIILFDTFVTAQQVAFQTIGVFKEGGGAPINSKFAYYEAPVGTNVFVRTKILTFFLPKYYQSEPFPFEEPGHELSLRE